MSTNAETTLTTLHNIFFSENKPEDLTPTDLALATYLVLRQTEDHFIYDSQDTLAERLGCERGAIKRSIERLKAAKWIVTKEAWQYSEKTKKKTRALAKTVGLSIVLDKLPQYSNRATRPSAISEEAKELARRHNAALIKLGRYGRRPKNFAQMQERSAQRLIEEFGGSEMVRTVINWALQNPRFMKTVHKSLYEVRRKAREIRKAYDERLQSTQPAAQPPAQPPAQPTTRIVEIPTPVVKPHLPPLPPRRRRSPQ